VLRGIEADEEGFAERDGVRVHYEVFGEGGEVVLLLPTWSIVHSDFWRGQVSHLAAKHTVVTFDGRGNGASDRPAQASAYAERGFAEDALAVLDAIGIERRRSCRPHRAAAGDWCWPQSIASASPPRSSSPPTCRSAPATLRSAKTVTAVASILARADGGANDLIACNLEIAGVDGVHQDALETVAY